LDAASVTWNAPVFGTITFVFFRIGYKYDIIPDADALEEWMETKRI
jgi:hypothetical protein